MKHGKVGRWSLDNKIALWGLVVAAVAAVGAIIVPLLTTGDGGDSVPVSTNNGQINVGSTVNNYWPPPGDDPDAPTVYANSCPTPSATTTPSPAASGPRHAVSVDLYVRPHQDGECYFERATTPGITPSEVELEIRYINTSKTVQKDVVYRVTLADGLKLIPGSTYLMNSIFPKGVKLNTDAIARNGIDDGSYAPGAEGFVAFEVETPSLSDLQCGNNTLRSTAYVQPKDQNYYYNTADINLARPCPASNS